MRILVYCCMLTVFLCSETVASQNTSADQKKAVAAFAAQQSAPSSHFFGRRTTFYVTTDKETGKQYVVFEDDANVPGRWYVRQELSNYQEQLRLEHEGAQARLKEAQKLHSKL